MGKELLMQSEFYMKEDIERILNEISIKGSWSQGEVARAVLENLNKAPTYLIAVQREAK